MANNDGKWTNKENKVRILAAGTDSQGKARGRLNINGGTFKLTIPNDPNIAPATGYKLYVKVAGTSNDNSDLYLVVNGARVGYKPSTTPQVYSADVSKGQSVELWLNNVDVYWIAFSTEAKSVTQKTNTTYPAASYSYNEDLNFDYTNEANSTTGTLTPYRASALSSTAVTLSSLSTSASVHANEGLILKGSADGSYYMVATARNMESEQYVAPAALETNYLKPTSTLEGTSISRFVGSESNPTYTNYVFSNSFTDVYDDDLTNVNSDITNADWKFARVHGSVTVNHNMAYLQISGRAGDINTSSSRAMSEADTGEDNSSVRPILNIIFDDNSEATDVSSVKNSLNTDRDAWYTLQGVRVNTPSKGGLYIRNGKKIAVK